MRAIVLAAGKGTRMRSARPKVLHDICGRPMLWYVLDALRASGIEEIVLVISPELREEVAGFGVQSVVQEPQLGTGHAAKIALERLPARNGGVLVACGDMPLVTAKIFSSLERALDEDGGGTVMALVTATMPLASSFGRIVRNGEAIERIVEVRDATPEQLRIAEMNAGIYAFDEAALRDAVDRLTANNAQKEYYLTDTVAHFVGRGQRVKPVRVADPRHVLGINDRVELGRARREMNARLCRQHMREGVTIVDPLTTYLEPELQIGRDTVIYPNTSIGRLSRAGDNCVLGPNSRLSNAVLGARVAVRESIVMDSTIGNDCTIGPYAHLRAETELASNVHVGNFVEIKRSVLSSFVKVSHLSYVGDAEIGEGTNVGAGTITCNYDGKKKHRTVIGRNVAIGSNSSLVAPVRIGDGALTGAGSVVTHDVAEGERVAGNPARPLPQKARLTNEIDEASQ